MNFSFVYNTYWVRPDERIPDRADERYNFSSFIFLYFRVTRQLIYYQWVPFLMALEAGFFYIPIVFWISISGKSGINITKMVEIAQESENAKEVFFL